MLIDGIWFKDLSSADEVVLIAENVKIKKLQYYQLTMDREVIKVIDEHL